MDKLINMYKCPVVSSYDDQVLPLCKDWTCWVVYDLFLVVSVQNKTFPCPAIAFLQVFTLRLPWIQPLKHSVAAATALLPIPFPSRFHLPTPSPRYALVNLSELSKQFNFLCVPFFPLLSLPLCVLHSPSFAFNYILKDLTFAKPCWIIWKFYILSSYKNIKTKEKPRKWHCFKAMVQGREENKFP